MKVIKNHKNHAFQLVHESVKQSIRGRRRQRWQAEGAVNRAFGAALPNPPRQAPLRVYASLSNSESGGVVKTVRKEVVKAQSTINRAFGEAFPGPPRQPPVRVDVA